jgi:Tfp pilus assembly protein PilN
LYLSNSLADAAFWVTFTFAVVIVFLGVQSYWTRWAHRRIKSVEERVTLLETKCKAMTSDIEELNGRLHSPWTRNGRAAN